GDSRRWATWTAGPNRAAPEALLVAYPDAVTRLYLPHLAARTADHGPDPARLLCRAPVRLGSPVACHPPRGRGPARAQRAADLAAGWHGRSDDRCRGRAAHPRAVAGWSRRTEVCVTSAPAISQSSLRMLTRRAPSPLVWPTCRVC